MTKIIDLGKEDNFSVALENLEFEINVRDMSDVEIRERLQKNYMGFLLTEWIDYKLKELEKFKTRTDKELVELNSHILALSQINQEAYPIEFDGRSKNIEQTKRILRKTIDDFYNVGLSEINDIWAKRQIEPIERGKLSGLHHRIKSELDGYKDLIKD